MKNARTAALQKTDSAHFLHPFTDSAALANTGSRIIERGEGVYIWDTDGNKIIDGMSGLWCVQMGYSQPSLVQAAQRQMATLPFYNSFFNTTVPSAVELADALQQITPPGFKRFFFTNSGSEANDTMLRLVRHYWALQGKPHKQTIISRLNAYHGSTVAGASLGGMSGMHAQGGLPIPGIAHIQQPYAFDHQQAGESEEAFGKRAAGWLEEKINEIGADKVAAFLGEPVQGAGGVIIPPKGYWQEIERICRRYDILLVADEVICGFGRLGTWFGCQYFGFNPDVIIFAKGVTNGYLPLGGVTLNQRVGEVIFAGGEFAHGFTYSGHPVCCALAVRNLQLMHETNIVEQVRENTAPYFRKAFEAFNDHPIVVSAQTCGMVAGLVLVADKANKTLFAEDKHAGMVCRRHCFEGGVVMRAVGARMILAPPLIISHQEIDVMMGLIRKALDNTAKELGLI